MATRPESHDGRLIAAGTSSEQLVEYVDPMVAPEAPGSLEVHRVSGQAVKGATTTAASHQRRGATGA